MYGWSSNNCDGRPRTICYTVRDTLQLAIFRISHSKPDLRLHGGCDDYYLARYRAYFRFCPATSDSIIINHAFWLRCNSETWLLRASLWCWSGCPPGVTSSSWLWLFHCCSSFPPSSRYSGNNGASSRPFSRSPLTQDTNIQSWGMCQSKSLFLTPLSVQLIAESK